MFKFDFQEASDSLVEANPKTSPSEVEDVCVNAAPFAEIPLRELMDNLPSKISYSTLHIGDSTVLKRDLFDAKFQLLAEDQSDADLDGDSDLRTGHYEGGYKTWECSLDLVAYLQQVLPDALAQEMWSLLELGCGTAIPSCFVYQQYVRRKIKSGSTKLFHLQDYNRRVIELVTLPNLLLAHYNATEADLPEEGDLEITEDFLLQWQSHLQDHTIDLKFFYGDWKSCQVGAQLHQNAYDLCLTSETVYNRQNIPALCQLFRQCQKPKSLSLVACKKIYFGLDGGEAELEEVVERMQGSLQELEWSQNSLSKAGRALLQLTF